MNFEVVNEPWNTYTLDDGSVMRCRIILFNIQKGYPNDKEGLFPFGMIDKKYVIPRHVPYEFYSDPSPSPTPLPPIMYKEHLDEEVRFSTLSEEWNEYYVEDPDNVSISVIRIKLTPTVFYRFKWYDRIGRPYYNAKLAMLVNMKLTNGNNLQKQMPSNFPNTFPL